MMPIVGAFTPDDHLVGHYWQARNLREESAAQSLVYVDPSGHKAVWSVQDNRAEPLFGMSGGRTVEAEPGEDIFSAIRRFYPQERSRFHAQRTPIGRYHPRIARPSITDDLSGAIWSCQATFEDESGFITEQRTQISLFVRRLEDICNVIHPSPANMEAYGHEIRNFILLACTEVESMWAGVLRQNGMYTERFTTNDYVKLSDVMRLAQYEIAFPNYPAAPRFSPFALWGVTPRPTEGIPWYAAYNAVKHRRETEFSKATLGHAFAALSACIVMMIAQFGQIALGRETELTTKFAVTSAPVWGYKDYYLPYFGRKPAWISLSFPF